MQDDFLAISHGAPDVQKSAAAKWQMCTGTADMSRSSGRPAMSSSSQSRRGIARSSARHRSGFRSSATCWGRCRYNYGTDDNQSRSQWLSGMARSSARHRSGFRSSATYGSKWDSLVTELLAMAARDGSRQSVDLPRGRRCTRVCRRCSQGALWHYKMCLIYPTAPQIDSAARTLEMWASMASLMAFAALNSR